ncbi:NAD(P)/FAD-dependent oxidoreductase [Rhodobacteraceae bacterium D3-12]|nr:NAD(P)/FAD-dependent oxidoreductase [Rhodobacteraceae bacterium D3-12]
MNQPKHIAIIGAGFTGLAAARDLARAGNRVTVYEADPFVGGLAGAFTPHGESDRLDRFYHHWFTSDRDIMALIDELGLGDAVSMEPSLTGVWFANQTFRLSTPLDLLRFPALSFPDRLRLGWLALKARRVRDWRALEGLSAEEWLRDLGGDRVYRVMWQPLLEGKFGAYASRISAVWMWNKLKLRGGSRGKGGAEHLGYMRGSFARVSEAMADDIRAHGGTLHLSTPVRRLTPLPGDRWQIETVQGGHDQAGTTPEQADAVIATPAPALLADMIAHWATQDTLAGLRRIDYLANLCLVLELDRSLGETYWLNVNDPEFPFVGVIEHTNFQSTAQYGGRHIVYLSRYLDAQDPLYALSDDAVRDFAVPHLKRMFPAFSPDWIKRHHVWRARWAQPVVERHYSAMIPPQDGPAPGLFLCSMAQIYPEDRGTNYAVRAGRALAARLLDTQ